MLLKNSYDLDGYLKIWVMGVVHSAATVIYYEFMIIIVLSRLLIMMLFTIAPNILRLAHFMRQYVAHGTVRLLSISSSGLIYSPKLTHFVCQYDDLTSLGFETCASWLRLHVLSFEVWIC